MEVGGELMVTERNETDARIAKLPKWAAEYIRLLEMRLSEVRAELAQRSDAVTPDTRTVADPYRSHPVALRDDAMVRFHVSKWDTFDIRRVPTNVGLSDELELYHNGSGDLVIYPRAANTFRIGRVRK